MHTTRTQQDLIVLDFETSGMAPQRGDRAIEIGAVKVNNGRIVDHFESLMNPGFRVSSFIEEFTGITNDELRRAPRCEEVMQQFSEFIGGAPLVAHNASFDQRFLKSEFARIGEGKSLRFGCSMLVARRLYPQAPNHKLATLVAYRQLPSQGLFHRALADAEMTAHLWMEMEREVCRRCQVDMVPFEVLRGLGKVPQKKIADHLKKVLSEQSESFVFS
ncbi:3'-5' exonuclease [uncultured Desulfuromonas sp.]|uniref:3'-5' exonuclease n=1 Tax=uncultured Desulfuromonas sp. TaxID=181013 RepID=UPI002AAAE21B|nr:3'-5' exonuclease [uncultured Desulfuromonas sp.]